VKTYIPYGGKAPHVATSETSEAAASSISSARPTLQDAVRTYIKSCGTFGATDQQIENALELRHQTASPRRRELVLLGEVVDSGQTRKTDSGRNAVVWVWVEPGRQVAIDFGAKTAVDVIRSKLKARLNDCEEEALRKIWAFLNELQDRQHDTTTQG